MNTQELKQYIDRTLGRSLKCLLSSYWWKKLFHLVLDRVEDINSETQIQLGTIVSRLDQYKYRRLVADDEDKEGAISNNKKVFSQIWSDFFLGGLMKEAREPLYVLTHPKNGEMLLVPVAAKATALIATDGYTYIEAFNVPFGDRVTNIMFKEDGTYYVDYGMQLYYRTDGGDLTAEQISANSDLVNNLSNGGTNGRLGFHQIKCVNVADVGGQIQHIVIGIENAFTFYPTFYVMEYDKVVKVKYNSGVNKNDMTTQIIGTLTPPA